MNNASGDKLIETLLMDAEYGPIAFGVEIDEGGTLIERTDEVAYQFAYDTAGTDALYRMAPALLRWAEDNGHGSVVESFNQGSEDGLASIIGRSEEGK